MKRVLFALVSLVVTSSYAQVGINTSEPKQELDVNGDVVIRNTLRFPDAANPENGNGGASGQLLMSGGNGAPPQWKTVNIAEVPIGAYYSVGAESISDLGVNGNSSTQGVDLIGSSDSGAFAYAEEMDISAVSTASGYSGEKVWYPLDGVRTKITIPGTATDNKISVTFQTIFQFVGNLPADDASYTSFAIGIFIDDKLEAVRLGFFGYDVINGFQTETVAATINDVTAGEHTIRIAVARRYNHLGGTLNLYVGKQAPTATNTSNFTTRSSITVQSYVKNTGS